MRFFDEIVPLRGLNRKNDVIDCLIYGASIYDNRYFPRWCPWRIRLHLLSLIWPGDVYLTSDLFDALDREGLISPVREEGRMTIWQMPSTVAHILDGMKEG